MSLAPRSAAVILTSKMWFFPVSCSMFFPSDAGRGQLTRHLSHDFPFDFGRGAEEEQLGRADLFIF